MRVGFAGTPEFARQALAAIAAAGHELPLVLTQPDRPAGRGLKLQPSPVKLEALRRGLTVAQPRSLRLDGKAPADAEAARAAIEAAQLDVLVVAAYGLILPQWTLDAPRLGCLNIHASLLPRWRGAAPIQRAIEAGDPRTGITLMRMEAGLDTGPMLAAQAIEIKADDTASTLHDRLAALGAAMIVHLLPEWNAGRIVPSAQPSTGITYAAKIDRRDAAIDWHATAAQIERRVRAFDPAPGATFRLGDEPVKLWRCAVDAQARNGAPGEVLATDNVSLVVSCGSGALRLLEVQRAGGRRVTVGEFLRSHPVEIGTRLQSSPTPADPVGAPRD